MLAYSWKEIFVSNLPKGFIGRDPFNQNSDRSNLKSFEKTGPPFEVDQFFRNFSGWSEPIHWALDPDFQKF